MLATMRRLSSRRVILDISLKSNARCGVRAQNGKDGKPKTAGLRRKSFLASSHPPILGRMVASHPLFVATNTVPRAPYSFTVLLVRLEVPTNS